MALSEKKQYRSWDNKVRSRNLIANSTAITKSRQGVTSSQMNRIVKQAGFSIGDWARYLHLSERSIQRYFKVKKTFELPYAERIIEIESLFLLGNEIFGDPAKFKLWLYRPNLTLGEASPASFLDTSEGIRLIMSKLHQIEHGIFA